MWLILYKLAVIDDKTNRESRMPPTAEFLRDETLAMRNLSQHAKRDITSQNDAQRSLKFFSMPASGNNDLNKGGVKYNYDESAGEGIRIYVIDSGVNFGSSVSISCAKSSIAMLTPL